MAISLAALLAVHSLGLRKAGLAETTSHQDIHWVAVTEQEDPQRFLNGGELELTTGMRLRSAPAQWGSGSAWVLRTTPFRLL